MEKLLNRVLKGNKMGKKTKYHSFFIVLLMLFCIFAVVSGQADENSGILETDENHFLSSIRDGSLMLNISGKFLIDVQPVKYSQYLICCNLGECSLPGNTKDLSRALFDSASGLSQSQKEEYCQWAGKKIADENTIVRASKDPVYGVLFSENANGFRCMIGSDKPTSEYFRYPSLTEATIVFQSIQENRDLPKFEDIQDALSRGLELIRLKDGMPEIYIPAGTFRMGSDSAESKADEKNIHDVSLSSFIIDKYEVSNEQYAACVSKGACTAPASKSSYRVTSYYGNPEYNDYPVIYVTWDQAEAYCEWAGMRLPTEAEWEYAARGTEALLYPWGNDYDASLVNDVSNGLYQTESSGTREKDISSFGVMDMGGNVSEWIWDLYSDSQYNTAVLQKNPAGPAQGYYHVFRGGSFLAAKAYTRSSNRASAASTSYAPDRGFRCASLADQTDFRGIKLSDEIQASVPMPTQSQVARKGELPLDQIKAEGGTFSMGSSKGRVDEVPVHDVTLSPFIIDKFEISNSKYAACVADGGCTAPVSNASLRHTDYYINEAYADFPVVNVTWQQAETYCEWAGGRLPTEAEWEYAAGGSDGYTYPWGEQFIAANLNYSGKGINDPELAGTNENDISPLGIMDMAGNVIEWVYDRYDAGYYSQSQNATDPEGPAYGGYRVIRGASYQTSEYFSRISSRYYAIEGSNSADRGFRCVYPDK